MKCRFFVRKVADSKSPGATRIFDTLQPARAEVAYLDPLQGLTAVLSERRELKRIFGKRLADYCDFHGDKQNRVFLEYMRRDDRDAFGVLSAAVENVTARHKHLPPTKFIPRALEEIGHEVQSLRVVRDQLIREGAEILFIEEGLRTGVEGGLECMKRYRVLLSAGFDEDVARIAALCGRSNEAAKRLSGMAAEIGEQPSPERFIQLMEKISGPIVQL